MITVRHLGAEIKTIKRIIIAEVCDTMDDIEC